MKVFSIITFGILLVISCNSGKIKDSFGNKKNLVGTRVYFTTDRTRIDPITKKIRQIQFQVWYPGQSAVDPMEYFDLIPYWNLVDTLKPASELIFYGIMPKYFSKKSNSVEDIPLRSFENKLPLLVFTHSRCGNIYDYTSYAETLASSGYFVVGINIENEANFFVTENKEVTFHNNTYYDQTDSLISAKILDEQGLWNSRQERTDIYKNDVLFCISEIENLNKTDFSNMINLKKIGIWGHSLGGAIAIDLCEELLDCQACVNMDGTPNKKSLDNGISKSFLFLESANNNIPDTIAAELSLGTKRFCEKNRSESHRLILLNAKHRDFAETYGNESVVQTSRIAVCNFFDKYLMSKTTNLTDSLHDQIVYEEYKAANK